jgi:hypothetical protein
MKWLMIDRQDIPEVRYWERGDENWIMFQRPDHVVDMRLALLEDASQALVKKLEEIQQNSSYRGIWPYLHTHGYSYDGPTWENELKALKRELEHGKVSEVSR